MRVNAEYRDRQSEHRAATHLQPHLDATAEEEDSVSEDEDADIFSGDRCVEEIAAAQKSLDPSRFTDTEPIVHTGDPFEEANVIRKAHRIKISGSAPPPPLRSFTELGSKYGASQRLLKNLGNGRAMML